MKRPCVLLNERVINIGEWDFQKFFVTVEEGEYEEDGTVVKEPVVEEQVNNPLPDGAIVKELECKQNPDGSWVAVEYEPIAQVSIDVVVEENVLLKKENEGLKKRMDAAEKSILGLLKIKLI